MQDPLPLRVWLAGLGELLRTSPVIKAKNFEDAKTLDDHFEIELLESSELVVAVLLLGRGVLVEPVGAPLAFRLALGAVSWAVSGCVDR